VIEVAFEIDGKPLDPDRLGDAFAKAALRHVRESLRNTLAGVRCPQHGRAPKVVCNGIRGDRLSFEVAGCCQDLVEAVAARLRR